MVLADSRQLSRFRRYLGNDQSLYLSCTGLLPTVARRSRTLPLGIRFVTPCRVWCLRYRSHNPELATPPGFAPARFGLIPFRSPLLRESLLLSFPPGTEMFQFPRFPLPALCVQTGVTPHDGCRVSPFGHPRIKACSAAPRGFSQPPTSFIGVRRQGIHRWLFVAWKNKDARARYAVLKGRRAGRRRRARRRGRRRSLWRPSPAEPRGEGRRSQKTEERTARRPGLGRRAVNTYDRRRRHGPDRASAPTGSRPCVVQAHDSLERR